MKPRPSSRPSPCTILFGVTSDQTLLVLRERILTLRDAGFAVTVIASPGVHLDRLAAEPQVAIHPIPIRRGIAPVADLAAFLRIFAVLARLRPSIVDFSTPKAALLGLLAARLLRIPARIHTLRGLRLESASSLQRRLLLAAERLTAACAHFVLCNSPSLLDAAVALAIAPRSKMHILAHGSSNGVDLERFHPDHSASRNHALRTQLSIPADAPVLGFVGRLTRHKGILELLDAFDRISAELPQTWLLLVGWIDHSEDRLDASLIARIHRHPQIVLTGFVHDVAGYYRAMNVFVLPTHREGFSNSALEAAATALPIVTTRATGARDAVHDGHTGLLVPVEDSAALASALLQLLRDPALSQRMGAAARAWAAENFSRQQVTDATLRFFQEVAHQHGLV